VTREESCENDRIGHYQTRSSRVQAGRLRLIFYLILMFQRLLVKFLICALAVSIPVLLLTAIMQLPQGLESSFVSREAKA